MVLEYQGPMLAKTGSLGGWKEVVACLRQSAKSHVPVLALMDQKKVEEGEVLVGPVRYFYPLVRGFLFERISGSGKKRNSLFEFVEGKLTTIISGKKSSVTLRIRVDENGEDWATIFEDLSDALEAGRHFENPFPVTPCRGESKIMNAKTGEQLYDSPNIENSHGMESQSSPSSQESDSAYMIHAMIEVPRVEASFYAFIRPRTNGDFKESWDKVYCIKQAGCLFVYSSAVNVMNAFADGARTPIAGYLIAGTTLELDDELGVWKWSNGKHSAYLYPAEGCDECLSKIQNETDAMADEWVGDCLHSAFGPEHLGQFGIILYRRWHYDLNKYRLDSWIKDEEDPSVGKTWRDMIEAMKTVHIHFFTDLRENDLIYFHRRKGEGDETLHRARLVDRNDLEIHTGKPVKFINIAFPSANRKVEVADFCQELRATGFKGPVFKLTEHRIRELMEKFPVRMTHMTRRTSAGSLTTGTVDGFTRLSNVPSAEVSFDPNIAGGKL